MKLLGGWKNARARGVMAALVRVAVGSALAAGCTVSSFGASDANLERAKNQAAHGAGIFERECASCHGARGEGGGGVPAILGEGALERYPRPDATAQSSYSGSDGQQGVRGAPAASMGRPELVTALTLRDYLVHHMPKIKRQPLTEEDYWAVVSFMLVAHGSDVPEEGVSADNAAEVAIHSR